MDQIDDASRIYHCHEDPSPTQLLLRRGDLEFTPADALAHAPLRVNRRLARLVRVRAQSLTL